MAIERNRIGELIDKLATLPPERIAEVEDFVDFLWERAKKTEDSQRQGTPGFSGG